MNALTTSETEAILTLSLVASFADGEKHERERQQLKKITASLAGAEVDVTALYQQVLLNKPDITAVAARLLTPGARQLAYEMAVCVCDADDVCNAAERQFLDQLRTALALPAAIKCVVIYEDFASGVHAKHFAEMLAEGLGVASDCVSLWRSDLMEFPEIGDGVAREAAASDFVIIALRGDRHLPLGFKRWIESWLTPAMDGSFSFIALFDANRSTAHAASARYSLREMSATAGVAFFAHCPSGNDLLPSVTLPDHAEAVERTVPRLRIGRRQRVHELPVAT